MFGRWLRHAALKARSKMLLQELSWDLQGSDEIRRARILILANLLRAEIIDPDPVMNAIVDEPFHQPINDLADFYRAIEAARNQTKIKHRQQHRMLKAIGGPSELSFFNNEQTTASERSLEVWMATAGSALVKNGFDYGKQIWNLLAVSNEHISVAETKIRELENLSGEAILGDVSNEQIIMLCRYIPNAFR